MNSQSGRLFSLLSIVLIIFILFPLISLAQADGEIESLAFNFKGNGARAMAMGGAYIAIGGDPSASFWNPAGLASIMDSQITASYNFTSSIERTFADFYSDTFSITAYDFPLDLSGIDYFALTLPLKQEDLFMVHQVSYRTVRNFGFSGSINNPYIMTAEGVSSIMNSTLDSSGTLQEISYAVGFKAFKIIQVGASYHHYFGGYDYTITNELNGESVPFQETMISTGDWEFLGDNFSIGIIVSPWDFLNIGAVFKTNYDLKAKFQRDANYSYTDETSDLSEDYTSEGEATIKYPNELGVGIALKPMKNLTIAADYTASNWLADQNEDDDYIRGTINDYQNPTDTSGSTDPVNYPTFTSPELYNQESETYLRIGAEYVLDFKDFTIAIRGGFWQHNSIFIDSDESSISWTGITAGAGIVYNFVRFDIALIMESASYPNQYNYLGYTPNLDVSSTAMIAQISYIFESF